MSTTVQSRARVAVLTLFTILLGITLGAGLYELRIEVPQWIEQTVTGYRWNAQAARDADTGRRFWVFVTTGPLTMLTLASLVLSWRARGAVRRWWLTAAIVSTADRAVTFAYFIPGLLILMTDTGLSPGDAADRGLQWAALDWGRQVLTLVAFLAALRALVLLKDHRSADQHEVSDGRPTASRPGGATRSGPHAPPYRYTARSSPGRNR